MRHLLVLLFKNSAFLSCTCCLYIKTKPSGFWEYKTEETKVNKPWVLYLSTSCICLWFRFLQQSLMKHSALLFYASL